jgi:hypothetical protein
LDDFPPCYIIEEILVDMDAELTARVVEIPPAEDLE